MQKSMDADAIEEAIDFTLRKPIEEDEETTLRKAAITNETEISTQEMASVRKTSTAENIDKVYVAENGLFMLPKEHPDHQTLIRLQLENQELMNWKQHLQLKINSERAECVRLKKIWDAQVQSQTSDDQTNLTPDDPEYDRLVEHYLKENALLEQKRLLLSKEIVDENLSLIQLQVELAMKHLVH
jgi:RalA-binding protein 1